MVFASGARGGRGGIAGDRSEGSSRGGGFGRPGGCKTRRYYLLVHEQDERGENDQNFQAGLFLSDPLPQGRRTPARRRGGRSALAAYRGSGEKTLLPHGTGNDAQGHDSPWRGKPAGSGPDIATGKRWLGFTFEDAASFARLIEKR